jgi:hypothetical protein
MTGGSSFCSEPLTWTPTQLGDKPVHGHGKTNSSAPQQPPAPQHAQQVQQQRQLKQQTVQPGHATQQQQQKQGEQQQQEEADASVGAVKLRHPRSDWLMSHLPDPERHFRTMAKVSSCCPVCVAYSSCILMLLLG